MGFKGLNNNQGELELSFYPYAYVRVNVMRSLLFKKADYHKLMKMSIVDITKYLQETSYGDEINELGVKFTGIELAERALERNLEKKFNKLRTVSDANLRVLVDAYLNRHDIWNMKTLLRAKQAKQENVLEMLSSASVLNDHFYNELAKEESMQNIFKKLVQKGFVTFGLEDNMQDLTLVKMENFLDKSYYDFLTRLSDRIPEQGDIFKNFLRAEINTMNLLMLLRLKREGMQKEQIEKYLFFPKGLIKKGTYNKLLEASDINDLLEKINKIYKGLNDSIKDFKETGSLMAVERDIKKLMLKKSRLLVHKDILSVNSILSYLFAKEIEINNLRMIVKGKTLGIEDGFIEKELVI